MFAFVFSENVKMQSHVHLQTYLLTRLENKTKTFEINLSQMQKKTESQELESRSLGSGELQLLFIVMWQLKYFI